MSSRRGRSITSHDIARETGVSQSTVSRALRRDPRISPATIEAVDAAARRLGYVPRSAARSLATGRVGSAAIVVEDLDNPFYPELVKELQLELERLDFRALLIGESGGAAAASRGALLAGGVVDGIIDTTTTTDQAEAPAGQGPIIQLIRESAGGDHVVVAANEEGGRIAARHLVELGHRRIGVIAGPQNTSTGAQRLRGFRSELEGLGAPLEPGLLRIGSYSHGSGVDLARDLLAEAPPPTAIFCGNDVIALGVLDAGRALGVDVPGELSVVGFDDVSIAAWPSFRLTTVRQPMGEMARTAARSFVDLLGDRAAEVPRRAVFPVELKERATTGRQSPRSA
jgi:LacI family transcriptional regulator